MPVKAYGVDFAGGRVWLAKAERGRVETVVEGSPDDPAAAVALSTARAEVEAGQAALAVAVPATATMMRELRTTLASESKAAKVWESLLDLDLPMPVEQTVWAIAGNRKEAGGGRRATAYALGRKDLEEAEAEWAGQGIVPTHEDAFPEALWAAAGRGARPEGWRVAVWLGDGWAAAVGGCGGEARSWHVLRAPPGSGAFEERFAARAGAFLDLERGPDVLWGGPGAADGELLARLEAAVRETGASVRFGTIGGGGGAMAQALARRAASGETVGFMAGGRANPAWAARTRLIAGRRRLVAAVAAAACIAACAGVLGGRAAEIRGIRSEIAATAARLAGRPVARGAERMMLGREPLAGTIAARNEAFSRLCGGAGGAAEGAADVLAAAAEAGAGVVRIAAGPGAVSAGAEDEAGAERLEAALEARGWTAERTGRDVRGRRTP